MSTPSARKRTKKTKAMLPKPGASQMKYGQAEVLSRPSSSRLAEAYKSDEFIDEWSNNVRFHVARNLLHLRRYRQMSQATVAQAVGTSQSAIARIESGQENITMDTLGRLIVALKGRFHVSIPPRESAPPPVRPWWEANESVVNPWNVVGYVVRHVPQADRLIVGERARVPELYTSTLLPKPGMLLEPSST